MEKTTDKNIYTVLFAVIMVSVVGVILAGLFSFTKNGIGQNPGGTNPLLKARPYVKSVNFLLKGIRSDPSTKVIIDLKLADFGIHDI